MPYSLSVRWYVEPQSQEGEMGRVPNHGVDTDRQRLSFIYKVICLCILFWYNLCLFVSAQNGLELLGSTPLLWIIVRKQ